MEILFLNHNVVWRSAFHRCFQLARPLAAGGHRVTIVTNSPHERLRWKVSILEGVRVVESPDLLVGPLRTGWDPVNVVRRMAWLRQNYSSASAPLVHAFDTRPTVIHPALDLKRRLGSPLLVDWGDWWGGGGAIQLRKPFWMNFAFEPIETFYEESFKMEADWLTCVSSPLRERAINLGCDPKRITIIPNPSDPKTMRILDRASCRTQLGFQPDTFYAIFSGYVLYDLEMVLRAMEALARLGGKRKAGLILTGAHLGLNPHKFPFELIQAGTVSRERLNQCLCAANVALMPMDNHLANQARFPGKVGDYLSAGLPVLSNRVGDIARILEPKGLAIFCDYKASSFAEAMRDLMDDPARSDSLGRKSREFAEREFNWEIESRRLLELYQKLKGRM